MLRVDLNFTLLVAGQRQKIQCILHKFYYLYPFRQTSFCYLRYLIYILTEIKYPW